MYLRILIFIFFFVLPSEALCTSRVWKNVKDVAQQIDGGLGDVAKIGASPVELLSKVLNHFIIHPEKSEICFSKGISGGVYLAATTLCVGATLYAGLKNPELVKSAAVQTGTLLNLDSNLVNAGFTGILKLIGMAGAFRLASEAVPCTYERYIRSNSGVVPMKRSYSTAMAKFLLYLFRPDQPAFIQALLSTSDINPPAFDFTQFKYRCARKIFGYGVGGLALWYAFFKRP